jgi:hypothetical protein
MKCCDFSPRLYNKAKHSIVLSVILLSAVLPSVILLFTMEQRDFKNENNCLNTNIYSYLETSGGQSSNQYLNAVHFFNTRVKYKYVSA